jgi:hypothetical protein
VGNVDYGLVSGNFVSERREEGIAKESRNMLKLGLFASCLVLGKLSGHRKKEIAKSSRNMLDGLCLGGLG